MIQVLEFLPSLSCYLQCSSYIFPLQINVSELGTAYQWQQCPSPWAPWTFSYVTLSHEAFFKSIRHSVGSLCIDRDSYFINIWGGVIYLFQHRFCFGECVWLLNDVLTPSLSSPSFLLLHWRGRKSPDEHSTKFWCMDRVIVLNTRSFEIYKAHVQMQ